MQGTMKCAIYKDVKNIVVETRDIPSISSQDILVKNLRAGSVAQIRHLSTWWCWLWLTAEFYIWS